MHLPLAQASAAHTILSSAITSGASNVANRWQCDPWFKQQLKAITEKSIV